MNEELPIHLQNFFLNVLKDNVSKTENVVKYYRNTLAANDSDPAIAAMLLDMDVDAVPFATSIGKKVSNLGMRIGEVYNTTLLFEALSGTHIVAWQEAIAPHYGSKTSAFKALFPQGRRPFQRGKELNKLHAIEGLLGSIGSDPLLATIKATIQAFYDTLNDAVKAKINKKVVSKANSTATSQSIEKLCEKMWKIYHELCLKYLDSPKMVKVFVPFDLLKQKREATHTTGVISKNKEKRIWKRQWKAGQQLQVTNNGVVPFTLFLARSAKQTYQGGGVTVAPGQQITGDITTLGAAGNEYLKVSNSHHEISGKYELELV